MKPICLLLLTSVLSTHSYSQTVEATSTLDTSLSVTSLQSPRASEWWWIRSKKHIAFKSHHLRTSAIENQILELESQECGALKDRDTLALMRLWARDFTLDKKQNELVYGKQTLPNYLSLTRMIESIMVVDSNTVFTSGYEMFQEIKYGSKLEQPAKRSYSHTWIRRNGLWKLTMKRTD